MCVCLRGLGFWRRYTRYMQVQVFCRRKSQAQFPPNRSPTMHLFAPTIRKRNPDPCADLKVQD